VTGAGPGYNTAVIRQFPFIIALAGLGSAAATVRSTPPAASEARALVDTKRQEIYIDLAPVDLPARTHHHMIAQPPVAILRLPVSGAIYGFRVIMIDSAGHQITSALIHHFNLIDPDHRELFLPISRRMAAAGHETGAMTIPWFFFGFPINQGERVLASAMLENLTDTSYVQARIRLVLEYTPAGRPWPLYKAEPFQMDVAFPVGDKSFDLPPGRFSKSYEGSPAVPGTIVGIGGHVHAYADSLEFVDATTGSVIYRTRPITNAAGDIEGVPVARLYRWNRLGTHIEPAHRYRVTVYYTNPTGESIPDGGMGVVGGLFVPDRGVTWPATNPADTLYQQDYRHAARLIPESEHGMDMHMTTDHHMHSMPDHGAAHPSAP